jgi:hypothetical protein
MPRSQGLTFKRVQRPRFHDKPLVQIVYLPEKGNPVALCVLKEAKADAAPSNALRLALGGRGLREKVGEHCTGVVIEGDRHGAQREHHNAGQNGVFHGAHATFVTNECFHKGVHFLGSRNKGRNSGSMDARPGYSPEWKDWNPVAPALVRNSAVEPMQAPHIV